MNEIIIRTPDDMHVHLRDGEMLAAVAPVTAAHFGRALVMPNLSVPVKNGSDVERYKQAITRASGPGFKPLMTVKLLPSTTEEDLRTAKETGAVAAKFYPEGVTTNSEDGAKSLLELYPALEYMQKLDMVLCLHGEVPDVFCMDREALFLWQLMKASNDFPRLKMVLEHVTTEAAVDFVQGMPENVAATITVHHLQTTLDDVVGGKINPHLFCKPIAKRPADMRALIRAATSGSPKFFLGTDSAPHARGAKECSSGCAGVYSAPTALASLAEVFDEAGKLDRMEEFCSRWGADFYSLPYNLGEVRIRRSPWTAPEEVGGVVPYRAGSLLQWAVERC